jgi:hypothetical protein
MSAGDIDHYGDLDVFALLGGLDRLAWYENRLLGDSNDDGVFNSEDLVHVRAAGKYHDGVPDSAAPGMQKA